MTLEALLPRLEFACGIEDAIRRENRKSGYSWDASFRKI